MLVSSVVLIGQLTDYPGQTRLNMTVQFIGEGKIMTTPAPQGQPAQLQNGMGTAALVMGILQFFCLGTIGSVLAIIFGKIGMNKADQGLANNRGVAKAGFVLGIIGLALTAIGIVIAIIVAAAGTAQSM